MKKWEIKIKILKLYFFYLAVINSQTNEVVSGPEFSTAQNDEYHEIRGKEFGLYDKTPQQADEIALSYMLAKMMSGVALLKRDINRNFKAIHTEFNANTPELISPFTSTICP